MRIAIDIDGTITKNPKFFKKFIDNQLKCKNEIYILTGALPNFMNDDIEELGNYINLKCRFKQLNDLGIDNLVKLKIVTILRNEYIGVATGKAEYCRDNKIDIVFEDDINYIETIKKISPETQTFLIQ